MANYGKLITAVSTGTANNLILDAGVVYINYGIAGQRILGATDGGNSFKQTEEVREITVDNKYGPNYKGLKRIVSRAAELSVNLKEMSGDNFREIVLGSTVTGTQKSYAVEYAGIGTTATSGETFTLLHKPIRNSMQFFKGGVEESTWTTVTAVASSTGTSLKIIGQTRLTSTQELTVSYNYWTTSTDTFTTIYSKGVIQSTDYITNICLVAPVSGSTKLAQAYIKNALSDGGIDMKLNDKNELVLPVTFRAHWTATMDSTEYISYIKYPK
jgi:hypothetical protein